MPRLNSYSECRFCRTLFRIDGEGCDICIPAKAGIDTPNQAEDVACADRLLRALESDMDLIELEQRRAPVQGFSPQLSRERRECAKVLTGLLAERRKQDDAARRRAKELTAEERLDVFLDMLDELPPRLFEQLQRGVTLRLEARNAAPAEIFEDKDGDN